MIGSPKDPVGLLAITFQTLGNGQKPEQCKPIELAVVVKGVTADRNE
jgi:hypothetical protein